MILSAKSTGRVSRLHGSRRGARTRTANGSHDQLVATISLPVAVYVKGFGCRPVVDLCSRAEGRRPKASEEGTRGGW
jgi:hypothetical protein